MPPATIRKCAVAALIIIVVLFADVIFLGASLAPLDYDTALLPDHPIATVSLFPEPASRKIWDGLGDIGAAAWQFQPSVRFMANCLRTGESPWWIPYEACGRMGPEGLHDVQFSPVNLAAAVFGGTSAAISFVLLALYFVAVFSLIRSLNRYLGISFMASCTAAIAYLLSGFSLSNLFTQMAQPYFLAPLLLLALFAFEDKPSSFRFALAAIVQAMMFAITFFPTLVLSMIAVYGLVMVSSRVRTALILCAVPVLGLALVAFLYLPTIDAHLHYVDITSAYGQRLTPGYSLESALSLFTPKHFWQSYRAMVAEPGWPPITMDPMIDNLGIIVSLVAACGLALYPSRRTTAVAVVSGFLVSVTVGQMFGIPPFTLIDHLPFFSFIRNEYWPALAGIPVAVLLALGLDGLGKWGDVPFITTAAAIGGAFLYLFVKLHLPTSEPARTQVFLVVAFFVFGVGAILVRLLRFPATRYTRVALCAGVVLEGLYYMNHLRPLRADRQDHLSASLQWVKQQIPNAGGSRIMDLGGSGIFPNWSSGVGVPEIGAMEMSLSSEYQSYYSDRIGSNFLLSFYSPNSTFRFTRESLSVLGVRFVIVDRTFQAAIALLDTLGLKPVREDSVRLIYENPAVLPRAFMDGGTVSVAEYHNTRVLLRTASNGPGTLILMDTFHPNWTARVDGVSTPVNRANTAFRGVTLAPGRHTVEFTYWPKMLTMGIWISVAALVMTLTLLLPTVISGHRPTPALRRQSEILPVL